MNQCVTGKVMRKTRADALKHIRHLARNGGRKAGRDRLMVYRCRLCDHFHVGRKHQKKKLHRCRL